MVTWLSNAPSRFTDHESHLSSETIITAVDDDAFVRMHLKALFEGLAIDPRSVVHVRGASEDEITGYPEYVARMLPPPTLVLLDQDLGIVNGVQLIPQLRERGVTAKIIIHTANDAPSEVCSYLAAGADGVIGKGSGHAMNGPCNSLGHSLARFIDGTANPLTPFQYDLHKSPLEEMPTDTRADFIAMFKEQASESTANLKKAIKTEDHVAAGRVLHALKGTSAMIGATHVAWLCSEVPDATSGWLERLTDLQNALTNTYAYFEKVGWSNVATGKSECEVRKCAIVL